MHRNFDQNWNWNKKKIRSYSEEERRRIDKTSKNLVPSRLLCQQGKMAEEESERLLPKACPLTPSCSGSDGQQSSKESVSLRLQLSDGSLTPSPSPDFPIRNISNSSVHPQSSDENRASSESSLASSLFGPLTRRRTVASGEVAGLTINDQNADSDQGGTSLPKFDFLKSVVAYVEVYSGSENRTDCVISELETMGASVSRRLNNRVTHCVFKDGKDSTYQKCKAKPNLKIVSVLWVDACKRQRTKADEEKFPVHFFVESAPSPLLGSKTKRLRSMQPKPLEVEAVLSAERVKLRKKKAEQAKIQKVIRQFDPFSPKDKTPQSTADNSESRLIPLQDSSAEESNLYTNDTTGGVSSPSFDETPERFAEEMKSLRKKIEAIASTPMDQEEAPVSSVSPLSERVVHRLCLENGPLSGSPIPKMLSVYGRVMTEPGKENKRSRIPIRTRHTGRTGTTEQRKTLTPSSETDSSISLGPVTLKRVADPTIQHKSIGINTSDPKSKSPRKRDSDALDKVINEVCKLALSDKKKDRTRSRRPLNNKKKESLRKFSVSPEKLLEDSEGRKRKGDAKRSKQLLTRVIGKSPGRGKRQNRKFRSSVFVVKTASQRLNDLQKTRESDEIEPLIIRRRKKKTPIRTGLAFTRLHKEEQDVVNAATPHLGNFEVTRTVLDVTTHVICGDSQRSVTALQGLAKGCWLLSMKWVYDSIEAEEWLSEEPYEMTEGFPAAKKMRLARQNGKKPELLADLGPIYVGHGCRPPSSDLIRIIDLAGGKIANSSKRASLCVADPEYPVRNVDVPVVSEQWLIETLMKNKLQDVAQYKIVNL